MISFRVFSVAMVLCAPAAVFAQTLPPLPNSPAPTWAYEYDAQGNRTKVTDARGLFSSATYDRLHRVSEERDQKPTPGLVLHGYDLQDHRTQLTDPRQLLTFSPTDGLGNVKSLLSTATGLSTFVPAVDGLVQVATDARGVVQTRQYDVLGRLTSATFVGDGFTSQSLGWRYDETTISPLGKGLLTSTSFPGGSTRYTHDSRGRVVTETQTIDATAGANPAPFEATATMHYDSLGQLSGITYPSGRKLLITSVAGRPSSMSLLATASSTPTPLVSGLVYEPTGELKSWQWMYSNGAVTHSFERDVSGRVVRYQLGELIRDVTYDAADRVAGYTHYALATGLPAEAIDQTFGRDELGRLISYTFSGTAWTLKYDANGNRTSLQSSPRQRSTYAIESASNRLSSMTRPTRTFSHDSAGNTTGDGVWRLDYDARGRPAVLTKGAVTTVSTFDAFGRRVRKFSNSGASSTVLFVYDASNHLLGEYASNGGAIREYVWLGDTLLAIFTPQTNPATAPVLFFVHSDHLGAPRVVLARQNQTIRWRWFSEPFGSTAADQRPTTGAAVFSMPLRLPGQYFDAESGLHSNLFRDYDPATGRYIQSDPIGLEGGINTYVYVNGQPADQIDPLGLQSNIIASHPNDPVSINQLTYGPCRCNQLTGHGNKTGVMNQTMSGWHRGEASEGPMLSPQKLWDWLRTDKNYDPSLPIRINSCQVGLADYCQVVADLANNTVICAKDYVWFGADRPVPAPAIGHDALGRLVPGPPSGWTAYVPSTAAFGRFPKP